MKLSSIKKLQECFCGKICTVLTVTVAKTNFDDQQFSDFFTGLVESIDEDGIFMRHLLTNCLTFVNMSYVVELMEEQTITEDDPNYKKIMDEIKQPQPQSSQFQNSEIPISDFIDPSFMAKLAEQAKEANNKMIRKQ